MVMLWARPPQMRCACQAWVTDRSLWYLHDAATGNVDEPKKSCDLGIIEEVRQTAPHCSSTLTPARQTERALCVLDRPTRRNPRFVLCKRSFERGQIAGLCFPFLLELEPLKATLLLLSAIVHQLLANLVFKREPPNRTCWIRPGNAGTQRHQGNQGIAHSVHPLMAEPDATHSETS